MKIVLIVCMGIMLAGGFTTSCSHYPTTPTDSTKCDTCHTDTTHHPCDTCNLNKDSLAHAFEWTEYTIPGEANLTGCWIFSPTDIRIMGNYFYTFDGTKFTKLSAYNLTRNKEMGGGLNGYNIFGFTTDDYWLISGNGSRAYHSSSDTRFDEFNPGNTNSCWGASSNDMFVVGNGGQIHHYDGTKFTDMVSGTTKSFGTISGTSNNNIWAAGWNSSLGESIVLHYENGSWQEDPFSISGQARDWGIGSVWTIDSLGHNITIISGSTVFRKTDNGPWYSDSNQVGNKLNGGGYIGLAVTGNSSTDFIAVGGWGFVSHWNGKDWKKYEKLFDYGNPNYGALGISMKGNIICIVGTKSGQSWIAIGRRK